MRVGIARVFFDRSPQVTEEPDAEIVAALERLAPVAGVGAQTSRLLRLCLDSKGYPIGGLLQAMKFDLTLAEALALERVSHRVRKEISVVTEITKARIERERKAAQ